MFVKVNFHKKKREENNKLPSLVIPIRRFTNQTPKIKPIKKFLVEDTFEN